MLEMIASFYIFIIMSIIAKIHVYWMKGGLWPGKNTQDLVDKVIGKGNTFPSTLQCLFVTIVFITMGLFPLMVYLQMDIGLSSEAIKYVYLFFALIFFIRASAMLMTFLEKKATQIFVKYNRKYYSPLCFSLFLAYFGLYLNL